MGRSKKEICILNKHLKPGQPIHSRVSAFAAWFQSKGFSLHFSDKSSSYIFYSMPPFRNFILFFKYKNKVVLDIRDGWAIAQASGYGGIVKNKPLKAWVTKKIECFMIRRSFVVMTCTPGLQRYFEEISGRKVLLIPNGVSNDRLSLIQNIRREKLSDSDGKDVLVFVCSGKFSEYGKGKVIKLLETINERYGHELTEIQLIGADESSNGWVGEYYFGLTNGKGNAVLYPRMDEHELVEAMSRADYGLTIIRDPGYDFGTKIYDYIALGLPVVNYFDEPNNFTDYFDSCLDIPFGRNDCSPEIRREFLIEEGLKDVEF